MKLADFLSQNDISDAEFAERIGSTRQAVHRYRSGERIPDREAMPRIVEATAGQVSPNDFYEVVEQGSAA